jgi:hypothetical protein
MFAGSVGSPAVGVASRGAAVSSNREVRRNNIVCVC